MTVDIETLEALAKAAKSGGAEWSDLTVDTERMYTAEGMLVELYEFATPAVLLELCNDNEALRGLYQMHKQTETREMRDLKAENAGLKTGYEAYERVNAELRAECESLREIMSLVTSEIPHSKSVRPGNAPGHCHSVPGVWDEDNGAKAGKECAWCKVWNAAVTIKKEAAQ